MENPPVKNEVKTAILYFKQPYLCPWVRTEDGICSRDCTIQCTNDHAVTKFPKDCPLQAVDASPLNLAEAKASLAAIHYYAKKLQLILAKKDMLDEQSIAYSIVKECEDRLPELAHIGKTV